MKIDRKKVGVQRFLAWPDVEHKRNWSTDVECEREKKPLTWRSHHNKFINTCQMPFIVYLFVLFCVRLQTYVALNAICWINEAERTNKINNHSFCSLRHSFIHCIPLLLCVFAFISILDLFYYKMHVSHLFACLSWTTIFFLFCRWFWHDQRAHTCRS